MNRVCLNRLRNEALSLSNLIGSLEVQQDTIQDLFDCIFRICQSDINGATQSAFDLVGGKGGV